MKPFHFLFCLGLLLQSCVPLKLTKVSGKSFSTRPASHEIVVAAEGSRIPENSELISYIRVNDTQMGMNCRYVDVINQMKIEAQKSGANLILLTDIKKPNSVRTCYRATAALYRVRDEMILEKERRAAEKRNASSLSPESNCAKIHFYRPFLYPGVAIGYKVYVDDENLGRMWAGRHFTYEVKEFGRYEFTAKTETEVSLVLDVQEGEEYFIRCGLSIGILLARPEMYQIESAIGREEMSRMEGNRNGGK